MISDSDLSDRYIGAQMRLEAARTWRRPGSSRTPVIALAPEQRPSDGGGPECLEASALATDASRG